MAGELQRGGAIWLMCLHKAGAGVDLRWWAVTGLDWLKDGVGWMGWGGLWGGRNLNKCDWIKTRTICWVAALSSSHRLGIKPRSRRFSAGKQTLPASRSVSNRAGSQNNEAMMKWDVIGRLALIWNAEMWLLFWNFDLLLKTRIKGYQWDWCR